ncbi:MULTISPECIES: hypothetical protein [unclassified Mycobacterium]|uniref:hypothetical protein n=1 Tax=unclassified Mycobacterium TaxID=2642494 RepID=UPI00073FDBB6|nr:MULTISPECIES: hypothetical protein [unclassified Mycobacterium]KUH83467.1 hypothetical protein AU186_15335 [Mycobacterium sp. GA-1999]KUH88248.1 hypothetical protein AU185_18015 [Mycobacterium sp. GA-0227b]
MKIAAILRDRVTIALAAAAMIGAGFFALYWPTSLNEYDPWGVRIQCGSGLAADFDQATIAEDVGTANSVAANLVAAPPNPSYVDRCRTALWQRRAWAAALLSVGVVVAIALLLARHRQQSTPPFADAERNR